MENYYDAWKFSQWLKEGMVNKNLSVEEMSALSEISEEQIELFLEGDDSDFNFLQPRFEIVDKLSNLFELDENEGRKASGHRPKYVDASFNMKLQLDADFAAETWHPNDDLISEISELLNTSKSQLTENNLKEVVKLLNFQITEKKSQIIPILDSNQNVK